MISRRKRIPAALLMAVIFHTAFLSASSVPEFTLGKMDGSPFSVSDVLGKKIILIDFWATWCKPCMKMLKKLDELAGEFPDDLEILAISTDEASSFPRVESYVKSRGYRFTVLHDPDSAVSGIFNPAGAIPFTLIVDRNKKIVYTHTGYIPGFEKELRERIIELSKKDR